jgi:acetyl-CoA carboxylase biotin carboxyl carrier protein
VQYVSAFGVRGAFVFAARAACAEARVRRLMHQVGARCVSTSSSAFWRTMAVDICAHITGTVWKIPVRVGETVSEGQTLVILESMKMEMPLEAPQGGRVGKLVAAEGQAVDEGDVLLVLETD